MSTPDIETAPAMAREMRDWATRCEKAGDAARLRLGAEMIDRLYALLLTPEEGESQSLALEQAE